MDSRSDWVSLLAWPDTPQAVESDQRLLVLQHLGLRMPETFGDLVSGNLARSRRLLIGRGSTPTVPFWGRCTTHFGLF